MADAFTVEQREVVIDIFRRYINIPDIEFDWVVDEIAIVVQSVTGTSCALVCENEFRPDVSRVAFFKELINALTVVEVNVQMTRPSPRIMHFTWHYGEHDNVYRIKCSVGRFDSENSIRWFLEKIVDDNHSDLSGDESEDAGMDYDGINPGQESDEDENEADWRYHARFLKRELFGDDYESASDDEREGDDREGARDTRDVYGRPDLDNWGLRSKVHKDPVSMQVVFSSLASLHKRLCRLGV